MIDVLPTSFEALDGEDVVFKVEMFDASAATVTIPSVVDVALWDQIAPKIRDCLVAMELTGTAEAESGR